MTATKEEECVGRKGGEREEKTCYESSYLTPYLKIPNPRMVSVHRLACSKATVLLESMARGSNETR